MYQSGKKKGKKEPTPPPAPGPWLHKLHLADNGIDSLEQGIEDFPALQCMKTFRRFDMIWFSLLCFIFSTRACQRWNCLFCIGNSQLCLYDSQSKSDWLFNTQSRVLQAGWLMMENDEKEGLTINMP